MIVEGRFSKILRAEIEQLATDRRQVIISGAAADYAAYRKMVGYLEALEDVLKLWEKIESEDSP